MKAQHSSIILFVTFSMFCLWSNDSSALPLGTSVNPTPEEIANITVGDAEVCSNVMSKLSPVKLRFKEK